MSMKKRNLKLYLFYNAFYTLFFKCTIFPWSILAINIEIQWYFCSFDWGDKYLPYYWPKQLSVLSILHFLYFLPLHVKPKASIYSSSLSHITATRRKCNKKYFCDTVLYTNITWQVNFASLSLTLLGFKGNKKYTPITNQKQIKSNIFIQYTAIENLAYYRIQPTSVIILTSRPSIKFLWRKYNYFHFKDIWPSTGL